jgi:hypothetical protein
MSARHDVTIDRVDNPWTRYTPACSCGWTGTEHTGQDAARAAWSEIREHIYPTKSDSRGPISTRNED